MSKEGYETLTMTWRRVAITVNHNPSWSPSYEKIQGARMTHTEVIRDDRLALPITETGYRSLWLDSRSLEEYDGILDYVTQWLDHEAQSKKWQKIDADQRQLKLF
jgi:hypothetical protein